MDYSIGTVLGSECPSFPPEEYLAVLEPSTMDCGAASANSTQRLQSPHCRSLLKTERDSMVRTWWRIGLNQTQLENLDRDARDMILSHGQKHVKQSYQRPRPVVGGITGRRLGCAVWPLASGVFSEARTLTSSLEERPCSPANLKKHPPPKIWRRPRRSITPNGALAGAAIRSCKTRGGLLCHWHPIP